MREVLRTTGTLHTLDEPLLRRLEPDLILTQQLCDVCAVDHGSVAVLAASLPRPPRLLDLEPSSLADIFADIRRVAVALGVPGRGRDLVQSLGQRVETVRSHTARAGKRPRCCVLEWIDPLYRGGHWVPALVDLADGVDPVGCRRRRSTRVGWDSINQNQAQPEVLVLACCGSPAGRTLSDLPILRRFPGWYTLPAVRTGRVYVVDGNAAFSRPGPRFEDRLGILAEILRPDRFAGQFPERGIVRVPVGAWTTGWSER